jgi:CrcB protein
MSDSNFGIYILAVAVGSAIGGVLRFLIRELTTYWIPIDFPLGTLLVNVIGCLLAGVLFAYWQQVSVSPVLKASIMIGLFGALTTFSSFSIETLMQIQQHHILKASLNIVLNVCICMIAVFFGAWIGGRIGQS